MPQVKRFGVTAVASIAVVSLLAGAGFVILGLLIPAIRSLFWPISGTNSPIKVGGGAMSFRAMKGKTWMPITVGAQRVYCLDYAPRFYEVDDDGGHGPNHKTLGTQWSIDFKGGNPAKTTTQPGVDGIRMAWNRGSCNGGTGPSTILLPIPSTKSDFYPDLIAENDQVTAVRFWDKGDGCTGPNGGGGDEDRCERLAEIDLPDGSTATCQDRECNLVLGP